MTMEVDGAAAFLTDNETKVDLLNNEAIAATIVQLLLERPDRPVTIGVHGDWGAGKSSVLEMIEDGLDGRDGVLCLKFNGWRFQGFEDAKIALLEGIITGLVEKRSMLTKAADKVKAVFRRIDWLKVAKKAGSLAFTAYTGMPSPDLVQAVVAKIEGVLTNPTLATTQDIEATLREARSLLRPEDESRNVPEEIGEFRKAFDELLNAANIKQLVVLIDDLDRCLPDTAIETLEAVRLFVFTSRTAFVVAADEAMIEYAVRKHFPDLPDSTGPHTYARNYLEKLIQVPFRIPPLGVAETRIYVTLLLVGAELGEEDSAFEALIGAARERLKRVWTGEVLDPIAVKTVLADKANRAQHALTLSDQIGPILASGTQGNPRQIKRFLNTLVLRQRTAIARGFGEDVKLPVLAKLMLAERFQPRLFDQIASAAASSPTGVCDTLKLLEAPPEGHGEKSISVTAPSTKAPLRGNRKDTPTHHVAEQAENAQLNEWLSDPAVCAWAAVQPPLADVDLRPYLFVSKDRKNYFGAASVLGHLATIAEQLLGPKIMVQGLETDLRRLADQEAMQVFEAVRGRIVGGDTFDNQPPGVDGLVVLVRAHPRLQSHLVDFLEGLPSNRLGAWAVRGWEGVITDDAVASRFGRLVGSWATQEKNKILRLTADSVQRTRRGAN